MSNLLQEFVQSAGPDFAAAVERIDAAIASTGLDLSQAIKWGQLTYARNGDFHHWICAVKITKKFVGLTFHFGGLLDDPAGVLIAGTSKFMRKIEYRAPAEVDPRVVRDFVAQAAARLEYFKAHWKEIQASD
jgi:hypothetical protein